MTPTPQEHVTVQEAVVGEPQRETIVISGMSGLYPMSDNLGKLKEILYEKKNPVTDTNRRWKYDHPEVSHHTGKAPGLDRFDAQFFKVHYRLAQNMDTMGRKILEQSYQAIYDAGCSPEQLSGKKIGVYVGSCFSETEKSCFYVANSRTGFGIAGCSKTMFANRVSYWLNGKGPSLSIDAACASSTVALEQAYLAMSRGECEAAIVGGANLCLHPQSSVHYGRIMTICKDGKTKSFDQDSDGIAKSEAINVLFLQKAKDAKRVYADLVHVKAKFLGILEGETGPRYGFYRNPDDIVEFIKEFYAEAKVSPDVVEYVEAFGSAVPEADKTELEALTEVYCKNRKEPLLIGSVMSNIGYGEAASGINAVNKVLLGYHTGELAANLHLTTPRRDVPALWDGRMKIITEHTPFNRGYTAVNGISVTGINTHVLLHGHYKRKDLNRYKSAIPSLVTVSARQDSAVKNILEDLKSKPVDPEEIALFHNVHKTSISGHLGRGYTILSTNENGETVSLAEKSDYFDFAQKPLWFVYSGMGSQWTGMGAQLMRIPIFAAAIEKCRKVLEPKGVDIIHILTSPDKAIFNNILNSFVGIAAVQIGLTDILTELGLVPDKIIGHSVGELGCAYADGCFTAEEMILSAYSRGLVSVQTPFIKGSMAAVGIGYQQIIKMCPPEIEVACHNGPESSTISGPADKMKEFVTQLTEKGIFAKEVPCSNIAYHSRYIAEAGPGLLKYLSEVIKDPKPRSAKWVSTSVPEDRWGEESAKYSSAEYHTNNLLSPVLFEETSILIPTNAVVVEIAPHGLLQAILKRSLSPACVHIPLTRRGHADNAFFLLEAIGKLYMDGFNPNVAALYPKVSFPVSTGTPFLSHLVKWAHNERWDLPLYVSGHRKVAATCKFVVSVHDNDYSYIRGNVIKDKLQFPFTAALIMAWDTLAMSIGATKKQISVQYKDIQFFTQPIVHDFRQLRLSVALHRGTGRFEVMDEESRVATGFIKPVLSDINDSFEMELKSTEPLDHNSDDIYQMLNERDYFYRDEFRSIHCANKSFSEAEIAWTGNWATFIDGIIQLSTLRRPYATVSQASRIRRIVIDVEKQETFEARLNDKNTLTAHVFDVHELYRCGGVLVEQVTFNDLPAIANRPISLQVQKFFPHFESGVLDNVTALQVQMQIVAENINKDVINVKAIKNNEGYFTAFEDFKSIVNDVVGVKIQFEEIDKEKVLIERDQFLNEADIVLVQNLSIDDKLCQSLYRVLRRDTFILNAENTVGDSGRERASPLHRVVSSYKIDDIKLELSRWRPTSVALSYSVVTMTSDSDIVLLTRARDHLPPRHKLLILTRYPASSTLKNIIKQWRKESDRNLVYLVEARDEISEAQNLNVDLDLAFNILSKGVWGGEYYVPIKDASAQKQMVMLQSGKIGEIDSLQWVETPISTDSKKNVTVHYAGLNQVDVKRAAGLIPFDKNDLLSETYYGMDFSGTTESGERVMGVVHSGALRGVVSPSELLWPVPKHWSMEDAATVPLPYAHAYYCLAVKCQLKSHLKLLVHGGAGALGQAAIAIGLSIGCEVYTTVSDLRKKRFLKKLFPNLKEKNIYNSRDGTFGDMLINDTKTYGCDIVITCVEGELRHITLHCCASNGFVIDTTLARSVENFNFGMFHLTKERSYIVSDFSTIFSPENVEQLRHIRNLVSEGISRGWVRPLTRVVYERAEAARAMRLLAASQHRGRVLMQLPSSLTSYKPRIHCSPDQTQIIVFGDELGVHLAETLINRGAKKLYLNGEVSNYYKQKIQSWKSQGVQVDISDKLTNASNVKGLLDKSKSLGPVESIFVVGVDVPNNKVTELSMVASILSEESKKLCPTLKNFTIVCSGKKFGQETVSTRVSEKLPVTLVELPTLKRMEDQFDEVSPSISWRSAVDAIEMAVRAEEPVVLAHIRQMPKLTLMEQIARISDISVPEDIDDHTTLQELGVEEVKSQIICAMLRDDLNITLVPTEIPDLSIQGIKQLEDKFLQSEYKPVKGLETFISFVDPDELYASTDMLFLPTRTHCSTMREDEFDVNERYLCIVPGLEGNHDRFRFMCESLKFQAVVIQPGLDKPQETIVDTAARFVDTLLKKANLQNNFYLLGYESGVLIALEMAAILEDQGMTGTIFCVGSGPEELKNIFRAQLSGVKTEDEFQNAVIRHTFKLLTGNDIPEELTADLTTPGWSRKVENCTRHIRARAYSTQAYSTQYMKALIETTYARIGNVLKYSVKPRALKSRLILLQAADGGSTSAASLQQFSQEPIEVHQLRAPLAHATKDCRVSAVVNSALDKEILELFEKKDLCETYLINDETFMAHDLDFENL